MLSMKRRKAQKLSGDSPPTFMTPAESDRSWRRLARLRNRLAGGCLGGLAGALVGVYVLLHATSRSPWVFPAFYLLTAMTVFWVSSGYLALRCQSQLVAYVQQTLCSRDLHSLGCWIDLRFASGSNACNNGESDACRADARKGVLEYLPLLTAETASLLRADDRHTLYRTLYGRDAELIAAVLQAVPILGDTYALRGVQHLADGKGAARTHPELQAQARSVLPRLQASLALISSPQTLLRASQPPQTPPEDLLIPAHATNETDPQELLRADTPVNHTL